MAAFEAAGSSGRLLCSKGCSCAKNNISPSIEDGARASVAGMLVEPWCEWADDRICRRLTTTVRH